MAEVKPGRHINTGKTKKGGAGGKGTWGKGGLDDLITESNMDPDDPNYCSEEEEEFILSKKELTSPFVSIIQDYLVSADIEETAKSLKELNIEDEHDKFVKKSIAIAMEHHSFEKELVSKLLSSLYSKAISPEKISSGFQLCLDGIDDLVLDNPDAVEVLSKFLARAIVDEIVPPAFLNTAVVSTNLASEVLALAFGLTTEKHRIDRLVHIWGPGDLSSVKRLKEEVFLLLQEYLLNGDLQEADKSVRKLNAPSFHFQLVKQATRLALQNQEDINKIVALLNYFHKTGLVNFDHIERGIRACANSLKDISLDIPNAEKLLKEFILI